MNQQQHGANFRLTIRFADIDKDLDAVGNHREDGVGGPVLTSWLMQRKPGRHAGKQLCERPDGQHSSNPDNEDPNVPNAPKKEAFRG